ncbi:MAG: cation:proton antiporter, partial [Planctomycetota bacterium]
MEINAFLLELLLTLLGARLAGELAARAGVPAMMGEMLAGIVLGPSLLGWISAGHMLHLLAEIGLILLLFEVGLDTNIASLMRQGKASATVAIAGFIAPLGLGFVL